MTYRVFFKSVSMTNEQLSSEPIKILCFGHNYQFNDHGGASQTSVIDRNMAVFFFFFWMAVLQVFVQTLNVRAFSSSFRTTLGIEPQRVQLTSALANISFDGLSGPIAFDGANRLSMKGEVFNIVSGGQHQVIGVVIWNGNENVTFKPNKKDSMNVVWGDSCGVFNLNTTTGYIPPDHPYTESESFYASRTWYWNWWADDRHK